MTQTRFTCTLTKADEPSCQSCARVTITDSGEATAADVLVTLSPRSTASLVLMLIGPIPKASTSEERKALELAEERSELGWGLSYVAALGIGPVNRTPGRSAIRHSWCPFPPGSSGASGERRSPAASEPERNMFRWVARLVVATLWWCAWPADLRAA